jgi:nucleoside-diphosphate-sugar epimerase
VWGSYGREKSDADLWLQKYGGALPLSILRPVYAYGPGSYLDRETHIWSRALRGRPVLLSGDGTTRIQAIHRDDLAEAVMAASIRTVPGVHVYNVAHESVYTLRDFAVACLQVADVDVPIITEAECEAHLEALATHPHRDPTDRSNRIAAFEATPMCLQVDAIRQKLGWSAARSLQDGLRQTFLAYTPSRLRQVPIRTDAEDRLLASYHTSHASS